MIPASTDTSPIGAEEKELLVFQSAGEEYAFLLTEVREIIHAPDITPIPSTEFFVRGVVNVHGKIVTVADLSALLGLQSTTKAEHIIVVEKEKELFGFQVDMVTGVLRVSADQLKPVPQIVTSKVPVSYMDQAVVLEEPARIILILRLADILTSLVSAEA